MKSENEFDLKPRRGGLFIGRSFSNPSFFFLFFGGPAHSKLIGPLRCLQTRMSGAAEKQKEESWIVRHPINRPPLRGFFISCLCLALLAASATRASDTLNWRTNQNLVTADIKSKTLPDLLEEIASITHWQVFLEPNTTHKVSVKFKNLPPGEALRMLLGDVNFALLPQTNANPKLFVFRTSQQNATMLIRPAKIESAQNKLIPNELIVRLKPGAKIDELASRLGAKVVSRIDGMNAYRLRFDDEAAADSARSELASNPDVSSVDSNYSVDRPPTPGQVLSTTVPPERHRG